MGKKQEINQKRRVLCQTIINNLRSGEQPLTVRAAFMNGQLPHGIALAWTGPRDAYLVNFKNKSARQYVREGKFLMKRVLLPLRVWVPNEKLIETQLCPACTGLAAFHNQYCPRINEMRQEEVCFACKYEKIDGLPVRGLTHNRFCDSLKIEESETQIYTEGEIFD